MSDARKFNPCIKRVVPQIVGNYTIKFANTKLPEFHFHIPVSFSQFTSNSNR